MSDHEHSIQNASNDVDLGLFSSIRKAADYYGIPKSTVAYRRAGRDSVAKTDRKSQRLSNEEERILIRHLQDLQHQNLCLNYAQIRALVVELLRDKGDERPLGKNYITRLITRYPQLQGGKARVMDISRLSALDPSVIERFFAEFGRLRTEYDVEIEDIYNMDETGFQMGQTTANYVVFDPAIGRPLAPSTDNTQWASIIECIGVNRAIKPFLIFSGKAPEDHMFPRNEELPDIIWAFSPKGWTDKELALD